MCGKINHPGDLVRGVQQLQFSPEVSLDRHLLADQVVGHLIVSDPDRSPLVATHPRPDLIFAGSVLCRLSRSLRLLLQSRRKQGLRSSQILLLRALGLVSYRDSSGFVGDPDGRSRLVALLAASPGSSKRLPLYIVGGNLDVPRVDRIQNGNRNGRGLHPATLLGLRDSLPSVAARFVREGLSGTRTGNLQDDDGRTLIEQRQVKDAAGYSTSCRRRAAPR